ncbi:hypothetical protein A0H81_00340 [Grifola frondosa]|uniref:GH16 domain-containing protein n=1 Tax=Grifola frondosa TaxID=5627 RepID=A0A1C7MPU1_GRIFR|nr:hypothetical protein A0H81_00340 [Grifola frondosa]
MRSSTAALFLVSSFVSAALGATYNVQDTFIGQDFLTGFSHQAIPDPTHGRVNYVDQATALATNLSFATADTFITRADSFTTLDPAGPGRSATRLQSNNAYTTHVSVFDIRHMPQGCGTWPAAWEFLDISFRWLIRGWTDGTIPLCAHCSSRVSTIFLPIK